MNVLERIPSVNYHLWQPCNMRCGFCFAAFQDIPRELVPNGHLSREDSLTMVDALADAGFLKINFAGGEPTLCPWLPDLIHRAKERRMTTSVVTNGSRITPEWLQLVGGTLDWTALSIDSVEPGTLSRTGRVTRSGPMSDRDYLEIIRNLREHRIRVKINTVVTQENLLEDLADFIIKANPERWKLLQVLPVGGQNDGKVNAFLIDGEDFCRYVRRNRWVEEYGITVIPETNDLITGSYVMVDPAGRFFDNTAGAHTYSSPITEVGVEAALQKVAADPSKFLSRNGLYDW